MYISVHKISENSCKQQVNLCTPVTISKFPSEYQCAVKNSVYTDVHNHFLVMCMGAILNWVGYSDFSLESVLGE